MPLYRFYPSIESFLDTAVKKTIDQAETTPAWKPFDITLLKVLFLIRYVDEMKGNVDNLVTLCLDKIDGDRLALEEADRGEPRPAWKAKPSSAAVARSSSS